MTDEEMTRIKSLELFRNINPAKFPARKSLEDIIHEHTRLVSFHKGDLIIRAGDYGNSAFQIVSGQVHVLFGTDLPDEMLGRSKQHNTSWFKEIARLWKNPSQPEVRSRQSIIETEKLTRANVLHSPVFVQDVESVISEHDNIRFDAGQIFGEISVLGRTPRTASIVASSDEVELLEIRWQGLVALRKYNDEFKKALDQLYRKNSLETHLRSLPLFAHLSKPKLQQVMDCTLFESYGKFEWQNDYKKDVEQGRSELLQHEPVIVNEGDYADGLLLVRSGFARLSHRYNNGHRVVKYLGKGDEFGFSVMLSNWKHGKSQPLPASLHAVGYSDILRVPSYILEELVFPYLSEAEIEAHLLELDTSFGKKKHFIEDLRLSDGILDFMSDYRYINGSASMLINMDRCIRCDECVNACAKGHNNNPRFIRHGRQYDHFMVANACMHCFDPVCMIGCPTGAIHRRQDGQITINDTTCIGCSTCAESCPYDNIRMVQARDHEGEFIRDKITHKPITKASKCDLCVDQLGGPACERACPHDALTRVSIRDLPQLVKWMER